MTPRFLLDTDTCIHFRKGRDAELVRRFRSLRQGEVAMSVVTHGELHRGALRSANPDAAIAVLEKIVAMSPVLPLPASAGPIYGEIRATLERAGAIIGGNDLWIAAHAVAEGLTLVTGNVREFRRVKGLVVEDWIARR